jgi:succinyl-diaminopimelate desuccinylase
VTLIDTLVELVDTPSVTGNEGRLCTVLAERLMRTHGQDGVRRVNNSLVVGRRTDRPMILLVGHIDTVPNQGQGAAEIIEDRLHGLGASDMKAGVAVMIHLLEDSDVLLGPYDVVGVFYDKEEGPSDENGLEPVLQRVEWLADAEFGIVPEPTDLELQLGCVGVINATVRFEGTAAHSARPWLGENAVTKAGQWLSELHEREPEPFEVEGLTFYEVFSVTRAGGGVANNVIPGSFEVNMNYRFGPQRSTESAEERILEITAAADSVDVFDVAPAAPIPKDHRLLDRLKTITGAEVTPKQAWTDVARLAQYGVPAVNYGPGETSQAHQVGESVPVANLDAAFVSLKRFLTDE